ncbi:MAG: NAD(P)/FAD-dependent oxidoreductase, partial [Flavobacteriales bacterium]
MQKEIEITLPPHRNDMESMKRIAASTLKIKIDRIQTIRVVRRSIDARKSKPFYRIKLLVFVDEKAPKNDFYPELKDVSKSKQIIIIGAGPAGLFAGLKAIELGLKPIIVDRGKDVKSRRRDLAAINKEHIVNPESNYCFGEGGAGTYSDGKLYTRSKKRGDVRNVLETLVAFGADSDILADAHPHIGTNKLPQIIVAIREAIIEHGGEVHFDSKMTDLIIKNNSVTGIEINEKKIVKAEQVILATGHSARDIYYLLNKKEIAIEFKPFALGVRIEHPQTLVDSIQYKTPERGEFLPPSSYSLVCKTKDRGVFSFCMCPGGIIAP